MRVDALVNELTSALDHMVEASDSLKALCYRNPGVAALQETLKEAAERTVDVQIRLRAAKTAQEYLTRPEDSICATTLSVLLAPVNSLERLAWCSEDASPESVGHL